jgi:hypothetical protein
MTTKTFEDYHLAGNPVERVQVPIIGPLINDDLGQAVLARLNEQFRGKDRIADDSLYTKNQPIAYSNLPTALAINQILLEETNGEITILSPLQVVQHWDAIPDKLNTYADTNSVSIFPGTGPNEDLRQKVLAILGRKKTNVPLIVSNLRVIPSDDAYGFTFEESPNMQELSAPFLKKDQRVRYDKKENALVTAESKEGSVLIWTPRDQSGIRRALRNRNEVLEFRVTDLLSSGSDGAIQIIQIPKGY